MTDRRTFIKTSSLAAAGVALASTMPMAACKGANEKLVCGAIGVNGMGWADLASILHAKPPGMVLSYDTLPGSARF